jgi:hypothetical protein
VLWCAKVQTKTHERTSTTPKFNFKQMNKWKENCKCGKNQITLNVTKFVDYKQDKMLEESVSTSKLNNII